MTNNKDDLLKLWKKIFDQVYETSSYAELFACSYLCRNIEHLDRETAKRNLEIIKKYKNFFVPLERGMAYAVVLSITKFFESKKRESLQYLVYEAKKFKIDYTEAYQKLKDGHKETIKKVKNARDNSFAHRKKEFERIDIPSNIDICSLLNDIANFLSSMGDKFGGKHFPISHEEFSAGVKRDFQLVLDNLYQ